MVYKCTVHCLFWVIISFWIFYWLLFSFLVLPFSYNIGATNITFLIYVITECWNIYFDFEYQVVKFYYSPFQLILELYFICGSANLRRHQHTSKEWRMYHRMWKSPTLLCQMKEHGMSLDNPGKDFAINSLHFCEYS